MAIGFKVNVKVNSYKKIEEHINLVRAFSRLTTNKDFQEFLKQKFLDTVNQIALELLPNQDFAQRYITYNQIRDIDNGFVLYNDMSVETDTEGYGGEFSLALAFEYGTGIVGQNNPKLGAWQYNVNGYENGWTYFKNDAFHFTKGLQGYEIYRFTQEKIKENLYNWFIQYCRSRGVKI